MQVELQQVVERYKIQMAEISHELILTQIALKNATESMEALKDRLDNPPEDKP